jgi:hypothetical protein
MIGMVTRNPAIATISAIQRAVARRSEPVAKTNRDPMIGTQIERLSR